MKKKIICVLLILVVAVFLVLAFTSMGNSEISEYKNKISTSFDYKTLAAKSNSIIELPGATPVYRDHDLCVKIGTLNAGDIVKRVEILSNGVSSIIYDEQEAWIDTTYLFADSTKQFVECQSTVYVVPDVVNLYSVDKSFQSSVEVRYQDALTRVATRDDGLCKVMIEDKEYYIQSNDISDKMPVVWNEKQETMYIKDFDGIDAFADYCGNGESSMHFDWADKVDLVAVGDHGWSKIMVEDQELFVKTDSLKKDLFPVEYEDDTCKITITKEWFQNAWCYITHLEFTDYSRLGSTVANNQRGTTETTSNAAKRIGALFCVNGPYMGSSAIIRSGEVLYNKTIGYDYGIYNSANGKFADASEIGVGGRLASYAVEAGKATDTFKFHNSTLVKNGRNISNPGNGARAQRTFIATNGNPGDIYIVVAEGRRADGESPGLRKYECAQLILKLGCKYGVMLDGGGSSTIYFNGKVLNSVNGKERAVIDFVYFK